MARKNRFEVRLAEEERVLQQTEAQEGSAATIPGENPKKEAAKKKPAEPSKKEEETPAVVEEVAEQNQDKVQVDKPATAKKQPNTSKTAQKREENTSSKDSSPKSNKTAQIVEKQPTKKNSKKEATAMNEILDLVEPASKPELRTRTFYLQRDLVDWVDENAAARKLSSSQFVNSILKILRDGESGS